MSLLLSTAPWLLLLAALPFLLRQRPSLSALRRPAGRGRAAGVGDRAYPRRCPAGLGASLATLLDSDYPSYEVVVAGRRQRGRDAGDRGGAGGAGAGAGAAAGRGRGAGGVVAAGWACWRGSQARGGELLVFTGRAPPRERAAGRAVAALETGRADLVSVYPAPDHAGVLGAAGHAPHLAGPDGAAAHGLAVNRWQDPADAVASPHFMLFRREAYEAVGGHEAVARRTRGGRAGARRCCGRASRLPGARGGLPGGPDVPDAWAVSPTS
jgi:hypothetical protein